MKWPSTSLKAISKKYGFAIEKSMVRIVFGTMISISSSFSLTRGKSMCLTNGFRSTLLRGQHVFEPMLTFNVKFVACFTSRCFTSNWKYLSQWTWDNGTRKNLPLGTHFFNSSEWLEKVLLSVKLFELLNSFLRQFLLYQCGIFIYKFYVYSIDILVFLRNWSSNFFFYLMCKFIEFEPIYFHKPKYGG